MCSSARRDTPAVSVVVPNPMRSLHRAESRVTPRTSPRKLECSDEALREHCREANTTRGDCEDPDYNRHAQMFDESALRWGDEDGLGWQMEVDGTEFHPGDDVTITMRNVSDEVKHYGASTKYNLQVFTEAGRTFVSCRAGTVDLVVPTDTKTSARANRPAAPNGGRSRSTLMPRRISGVRSRMVGTGSRITSYRTWRTRVTKLSLLPSTSSPNRSVVEA